jgi:transposase
MKKACITNLHGQSMESLKKERMANQSLPKAQTKITVIMMCLDGHGVLEIERLLKINKTTIGKYIKKFNCGGLEELLKYGKSSGAPCKLSESEQVLFYETVLSTPKDANCGKSVNWTSKLLQEFITKTFNKTMTAVGVQIMLHRMGFSFTRPTYTLARADKKNL